MKTRRINYSAMLVLVAMVICTVASGQVKIDSLAKFHDTSATVQVKLKEGSSYIGKFSENRNDTLTILTADLGAIRIAYGKIKSAQILENKMVRKGKYWFPTPLPGRYFFAPSAFTLEPGEGYYQNTLVVFNSFNVGVTRWFSVGGGIEFLTTIGSLTAGDFMPTFYITPKVGFKVANNLRLGAGVLYAQVLGDQFRMSNFYGLVTYGTADYNITGGIGLAYSSSEHEEWVWQKNPMITLSGTARLARKLAFVSENWIIPGAGENGVPYAVFSYGLRFLGESISVDLAFINNKDIAQVFFMGIPFVSFAVKF
ncbi:MAG: hypothetical protein NT040_10090 [Bacteroidetes bacterium]|nr:hypothetical protein [Bacteroidota bacterium]